MEPGGRSFFRDPVELTGDNVPDSEGLQGREIGLVVDEIRGSADVVGNRVAIMAGDVGDLPGTTETVTRPKSLTTCFFLRPLKTLVP